MLPPPINRLGCSIYKLCVDASLCYINRFRIYFSGFFLLPFIIRCHRPFQQSIQRSVYFSCIYLRCFWGKQNKGEEQRKNNKHNAIEGFYDYLAWNVERKSQRKIEVKEFKGELEKNQKPYTYTRKICWRRRSHWSRQKWTKTNVYWINSNENATI